MSRAGEYGLVALVVLVIIVLFRVSRLLLHKILHLLERKYGVYTVDHVIVTGFLFLLIGLLFLPFISSVLGFANRDYLPGGMIFHLVLVAVSVVLFSFAEDLFGSIKKYHSNREIWKIGKHMKIIFLPVLAFLATGILFLSPVFYTGLTIILLVFYFFALWCRPEYQGRKR